MDKKVDNALSRSVVFSDKSAFLRSLFTKNSHFYEKMHKNCKKCRNFFAEQDFFLYLCTRNTKTHNYVKEICRNKLSWFCE